MSECDVVGPFWLVLTKEVCMLAVTVEVNSELELEDDKEETPGDAWEVAGATCKNK